MKLQRVDYIAGLVGFLTVAVVYIGWNMYWDKVDREERRVAWAEKREAEAKEAQAKIDEPASTWFALRGISIKDFVEGEDPTVVIDREVKKPFIQHWILQVHRVDVAPEFPPVCETSGTVWRTSMGGDNLVTLSWSKLWGSKPCHLYPGNYILREYNRLEILGYPDKEVERVSDIFAVLPMGSEKYVTPKIIEQLGKAQELLENPVPVK